MADAEYWIIGGAFALCALSFFCVVVPRYAVCHVGPRKPPPLPRGRVKTTGMGVGDVIGVGLVFALYAGSWLASQHVDPGDGEAAEVAKLGPALLLGEMVLQAMLVGFVVALLCWRADVVDLFGLRWRRAYLAPLIGVLVVVFMFSLNLTLSLAGYNEWIAELPGVEEDPSQDSVKLLKESNDPLTLGMMALVACIGAPISEEVVFRGYVYGVVKKLGGIGFSVVFSGLFFAAVHVNLASLLPLFVLGVALALVYEWTGSLWAPIAVHFFFNSSSVLLLLLSKVRPEWFEQIEKL